MSLKTSCVSCQNKDSNGIFKCEGCLQTFCLKHTNQHRDVLNHQLDEIISEHENIFQTFTKNDQQSSVLFDQIDQWEKDSIIKIQQTAQDTRIQIQRLADLQKECTKEKMHQTIKQLEYARENQEYLEKDIYRWNLLLEKFKYDLTVLSPSIIVYQDPNQALINKIFISKVNQQSILNDTLISYSDQIQFDDNHSTAMYCGSHRAPAYIMGTQEYSSGQHQIRLFISKKTSDFSLSFNIMSKLMQMPTNDSSHSEFVTYGWQSDDCITPSHNYLTKEKVFTDMKGKTKFHIELLIDCDNQKISYFNEKTKRKREMNVDVKKCPLPWKLYFYLYDIGDSVRLLSSSQIS